MNYLNKISVRSSVRKRMKKVDKNTKNRLYKAIEGLRVIPPKGDVRKMSGHENVFRCRVGEWRILFTYNVNKDTLIILNIDRRGQVYK